MNKIIVIVDDDIELQQELKELLVSGGYEVRSCIDGESALQSIPDIMPDLILLDMKLGKINGFQVAERLKQMFGACYIPVIVMTGYYAPKEMELLKDICGVTKCITKPINPENILVEIDEILHAIGTTGARNSAPPLMQKQNR